ILDPATILPEGKTLLCVGLGHSRPATRTSDGARVARYAAGVDYHNHLGRRLLKLARRLEAEGLISRSRKIVDAGPLLERSHAAEAGIGFESKAANLLHPKFGPWFFLGELILDVDLAPTGPSNPTGAASCGTCTACLDICPTDAILEPGVVDARRCLSYQTIENRGPIPEELREDMDAWVFGCDLCSEVCPWERHAPDLASRFGTHRAVESDLVTWIETPAETFAEDFRGSPLQRARREGLARNAAIVLGNHPQDGARSVLLRALSLDPAELVRGAAAWALGRGYGQDEGTRDALEAATSDPSPEVRDEARRARGQC
ncbi:MAG: tRNA epoxyqueuosine(34) reductase QueG, partial [Planctomycetota bacterium]|nr:tRNA epoxyqueuosine(34) reductase QueG [Planctomycetota bacterium]